MFQGDGKHRPYPYVTKPPGGLEWQMFQGDGKHRPYPLAVPAPVLKVLRKL